jgi:hypothetical protein
MQRNKNSSKMGSDYDPILYSIRDCLRENYTLYHGCLVAIACAAACHEDASAWFVKIQQVVEGITEVRVAHTGVLYLLREKLSR